MAPIDFRGYSHECLVHGLLTVPDEFRLTDFLNRSTTLHIANGTFYALADGLATPAGDVDLALADLLAVEPTDTGLTPWHTDLRVSTRSVQIEIDMAPYRITGLLHGHVSADPIEAMGHRRAMVPLTDAVVHFEYRGRSVARSSRALIINRERARRIRRVASEPSVLEPASLVIEPLARLSAS